MTKGYNRRCRVKLGDAAIGFDAEGVVAGPQETAPEVLILRCSASSNCAALSKCGSSLISSQA